MLIIKIDHIHTEPAQTCFACLTDVIGLPLIPRNSGLAGSENPKFCRNNDLFAVPSKGAPKQLLVCVRAVHIGGVEECNSQLKRAINCSQRFFISSAVKNPTSPCNRDRLPKQSVRHVQVFVVSYFYDSVASFTAVAKSAGNGASKFLQSPLRGWRNPIFQECNICRGKSFVRRAA